MNLETSFSSRWCVGPLGQRRGVGARPTGDFTENSGEPVPSGGGEEGLNLYLQPFAGPPFYHLNYAPKESGWSPRNIT
jgi:hypothetical protein